MNDILVDTNVLVYAIDEDSAYFEKAHRILVQPELNLYTTSKNLSEFLSVVTRSPRQGLPVNEAITVVEDFAAVFNILYPTAKSYGFLINLLKQYQPSGLQIHDFEIASIGLANGIHHIATVNEKDFIRIAEIDIYSL